MPKRKAKGRSSADTSKESTPLRGANSDDDTSPSKAPLPRKRLKKAPKSSAELCDEFGMNDVDLEYSPADYQNLTTFSLFMRMVRPQIVAANNKVAASKMSPVLEAKWREFNESNPYNREKDTSEEDAKTATEEEKEESSDSASDTSGPYEVKSKKIPSLKIRLPMVAVRKSLREKKSVQKVEEEEEDETSGDDTESVPKRKSRRTRADDSDDAFEVYSDSDTEVRHIRKRKTVTNSTKRTAARKEESSSEETEEDDSSDSSEETAPKKRRPVIPGERKSERERQSKRQMSDKEFERLMRAEEKAKMLKKEKAEAERKKKMKKIRKKKKMQMQRKKDEDQLGADAVWEVTGGDGNDSDHSFYCVICKDGGDLLLCDTCPRSFHKECLKLEDLPEGDWSCPICQGQPLPEVESEDESHDQQCRVCKERGEMILCDFCPGVYHLDCLNPPLITVPEGDWKCPQCEALACPLKGKVMKILTWKWSHKPTDCDELDHTCSPRKKAESKSNGQKGNEKEKKPERLLLVKYEFHSYWDCDWIREIQLEVHQYFTYRVFKLRWDQDEPPALEDGSSQEKTHHRSKSNPDDPHNLEERYYKYGIKPEWLTIHRVLVHEGKKDMKYLVKWRGMAYEEATWEEEDEISDELRPEWKKQVKAYWTRLKEKTKTKRDDKKKPKKSELKVRLQTQPSYVEKTGGRLHPYQLEGLNWLRFSWAQGTNTILADEMGLGKTIQTIAFLSVLYNEGYTPGPFLICAPLSTVSNWEREFEFWAPDMYVVTYTGGKNNRAIIRERDMSYSDNPFASVARPSKMRPGAKVKFDVLLTSYELVSHDQTTLQSIDWAMLVIDEAHKLKNNQSLFFRVLVDYKLDYKLLLTGTPLQNTLEELFNLLNFMDREKFKEVNEFLDEFAEISKDEQVSKLHELLAPHMLRRLKADVLKDIPSKTELILRVELSDMQKKFYKHILTKNYAALNVKGSANQTSLANIMMDLRKCSNHPYLFPSAERDAPLTKKGLYEGTALVKASGKLELLEKMLRVLKRDGHRVLIFSQMTRMLNILEDFLEYCSFKFERIDGNIMGDKRQDRIDSFNDTDSDSFVFLLSTKAGGLGINLATADTVIIYDMDWNPHNDIQAFSRAHRIGQRNKVLIYRFVSKNTIEEKIVQVCKRKMMLTELVIHKGMGSGSAEKKDSLTKQEVNDILKFGAEDLFKDDEEGKVVYDDAAVEKLLNRQQVGEVEKDFGMNEYLCSFKVASYQIKDTAEEEEETARQEAREEQERKDEEAHYWERVLGDSYALHLGELQREQEEIAKSLGKGKRIRKQINYAEQDGALKSMKRRDDEREEKDGERVYDSDMETKYLSDYEPNSSDSDEEEDEDFVADGEKKTGKSDTQDKPEKVKSVGMPPLLAKYKGNIEVLGFTARQRRSFLDTVMRFGMPPENVYKSQWMVRDLTKIAENAFKAYVSLFMRHLCEPISDNAQFFADGVPREGLSRQHVLTRIGMIALIRRKVHEFEAINDIISMDEFGTYPDKEEEKEKKDGDDVVVVDDSGNSSQEKKEAGERKGEGKGDRKEEAMETEDSKKTKESKTEETETEASGDVAKEGTGERNGKKKSSSDGEMTDSADEDGKEKEKEKEKEKDKEKSSPQKDTLKTTSEKTSADDVEKNEMKTSENDVVDMEKDTVKTMPEEDDVKTISEKDDEKTITEKDNVKTMPEKDDEKTITEKDNVKTMPEKDNMKTMPEKDDVKTMPEKDDVKTMPEKDDVKTISEKDNVKKMPKEDDVKTISEKDDVKTISEKDNVKTISEKDNVKTISEKDNVKTISETEPADEVAKDKAKTTSEKESADDVTNDDAESKLEKDPVDAAGRDGEMDGKKEEAVTGNGTKDDTKEDGKIGKESEGSSKEEDVTKPEISADDKKDIGDEKTGEKKDDKSAEEDKKVENKGGENESESDDKEVKGAEETKEKAEKQEEKKKREESDKDAKETDVKKTEKTKEGKKVTVRTFEEVMVQLRRRFWIADGGFTDLHRLWVTEEQSLIPGREYNVWHRLHDYWLLAGIVTHGYRHWQDILGDPRFEILNHAFQSEGDKMRKAAFLNRRFQLIEQALVIEEQLRKALHENKLRQGAKKMSSAEDDGLSELDNLAANLRRLNQGQPPLGSMSEKKLHNVLNTVSALVNDIKAMSYTSMPATLAKATTGTATVPAAPMVPAMPLPPMTRLPVVGGVLMPAGTQPPPLQQMRLPAPPMITVQPRPAQSGVKDVICID